MKFIHVLTVPMSLAALTVMGGADGCVEDQGTSCQAGIQQMQFVGYEGCQDIEFCDGKSAVAFKPRAVGVAGHELALGDIATYPSAEGLYLTSWLYLNERQQLCATRPEQSVIDAGAPTDKSVSLSVKINSFGADGIATATYPHIIQAAVQTIDFQPEVSNATHQVSLQGQKVAVFVSSTPVGVLKVQPNLPASVDSGTIRYEVPNMSMMAPVGESETTMNVSPGIAIGGRTTLKATLDAAGESIVRDVEVRVVGLGSDPIIDIRPTDLAHCDGIPCATDGGGTDFVRKCFTRRESVASVDGSQSTVRWSNHGMFNGDTALDASVAVARTPNSFGDFLVCHKRDIGTIEVRMSAYRSAASAEEISLGYAIDTTLR